MKRLIAIIALFFTGNLSFAQQKYFEGTLLYHVSVIPKNTGRTEEDIRKILGLGNDLTITMKDGNYFHKATYCNTYYILKDKKAYLKFPKLDTLYYLNYSYDTSQVTEVKKSEKEYTILNYSCKEITIRTARSSMNYRYALDLMNNPAYDADNTIGNTNVYARETGGRIYLWAQSETSIASYTNNCTRVDQHVVDAHVFDLPELPKKEFNISTLYNSARFPGNADAWAKYLNANLNTNLAAKYLKIPKGSSEASQTVYVQFAVSETGAISDITVTNKNEVNSHLADEAVRVIGESPRWIPSTIYGEKISGFAKQPVVFKVMN